MSRPHFQLPRRDPGRPKVPEVVPFVQRYYGLPGNGAGGHLHVVLDDQNLKDHFLRDALAECLEIGDYAGARIAALMLLMTPTQRRRVVGRRDPQFAAWPPQEGWPQAMVVRVPIAHGPFTYDAGDIQPLPIHGVLGRPKVSP